MYLVTELCNPWPFNGWLTHYGSGIAGSWGDSVIGRGSEGLVLGQAEEGIGCPEWVQGLAGWAEGIGKGRVVCSWQRGWDSNVSAGNGQVVVSLQTSAATWREGERCSGRGSGSAQLWGYGPLPATGLTLVFCLP